MLKIGFDYFKQVFRGIEIVEIWNGLFQSSEVRWKSDIEKVGDLGIEYVIDVSGGFDMDMSFIAANLHWPFSDGAYLPDLEMLNDVAYWGACRIIRGKKVLVHCTLGRNRSSLVNAMILRFLGDVSGSDAVKLIRGRRPGAFSNSVFRKYVEGLGSLGGRKGVAIKEGEL